MGKLVSHGKKNKNQKLQPERAAELMGLVGTVEGQRRFPRDPFMKANDDGKPTVSRAELVEKYEIKSFVSKTNSEVNKKS